MNENQNTPELRFEGFTEPWKQQKLGDVAEIVGGGTPDTSNPDYWDGSIDWYSPVELGDQIYADRSVRRITDEGYANCSAKMLPAGRTILFTSRAGIGNTAILRRPACTNQGFQSIVIHDDVDVYFLYTQSTQMKQWAEKKASGSTFLEISGKQLAEMPLRFPRFEEQEKIGIYFQHLDSFIALQQRKYERLQHLKQALLRKMFPKPGEQVPKLRFEGFTEPWEQRKVSDIATLRRGLTYSPSDVVSPGQGVRVLRSSNVDEDRFVLRNDDVFVKEEAVNIPFSRDGEVLITAANGSTRLVGKRAKISGLMGKTVHGGFMLIAATEQPDFLCALMGTEWYRNFLHIGVAGGNGAIGNLDSHALECEKIRIPSSDEQHLVGGFFRDLDSLIDLQQRKYERLQHLKQALLRKMFV